MLLSKSNNIDDQNVPVSKASLKRIHSK